MEVRHGWSSRGDEGRAAERRLLDAAVGMRFEAAFVVAVVTGVRLGEMLALRWVDLDLDLDLGP